ncbi:MAG: putative lipid II flippase FtsW [Deltaproteobacteria bacterium]|nr:putative lipid II flippase FtsW [Deltaproteobacteria bacterium]
MDNKSVIQNLLIFISVFLVGLGVIMIYSSSSIFAAQKFNDSAYFLKKQTLFGICGIIGMLIMMRVPYSLFTRFAYPLWAVSIVLLSMVLIPGIGTKVGGAVRWLRMGPLSFQPVEFAKFAVIILFAYTLSKKGRDSMKKFTIGVLPHFLLLLPICGLVILQPDFGNFMLLLGMLLFMLFAAGTRISYLALLGIIALVIAAGLICLEPYRLERIMAFQNPWKYADTSGYQLKQSLLSFGSGGITGTGLGRGTQKLFYLPEPHTDFILSIIGEELGFLGVMLVIGLFMTIIYCGIKVALHAEDLFGTYMALGIVLLLGLQATLNMGVVMGLLPTKGMPLPFVSYGGTSLIINLACVGVLLSISAQCNFSQKR